jgi:hypothetical protein
VKPRKKQMKTPHKHAELIHAWADGAEIESLQGPTFKYCSEGTWVSDKKPLWHLNGTYRVKPGPKPDETLRRWVLNDGRVLIQNRANVIFTFDGETGKLKSSEVI